VLVGSRTPGVLYNEFLAGGCGGTSLRPVGSPPRALVPNPVFGFLLQGLAPAAPAVLFGSAAVSVRGLGSGCTLLGADPIVSVPLPPADASGITGLPLPVPNIPALEGGELIVQGISVRSGAPLFGLLELSNGVRVRVGNAIPACR
jgi:hypothetical protein